MRWHDIITTMREKGAAIWLRLSDWWSEFSDNLQHRHRLSVLDTHTLKERFAMELTGTNIIVALGTAIIVIFIFAILVLAYTPMREIIPGYVSPEVVEQSYRNTYAIDSLERIIYSQNRQLDDIKSIVSGKTLDASDPSTMPQDTAAIPYRHSKADSLLRLEIDKTKSDLKKTKKKKK